MMAMACLRWFEDSKRCGFHYKTTNIQPVVVSSYKWGRATKGTLNISLKTDRLFKKSKHMKNHRWMNNWHISFEIFVYVCASRWNNSLKYLNIRCCVFFFRISTDTCDFESFRRFQASLHEFSKQKTESDRFSSIHWTYTRERKTWTDDWNISTWWLFWNVLKRTGKWSKRYVYNWLITCTYYMFIQSITSATCWSDELWFGSWWCHNRHHDDDDIVVLWYVNHTKKSIQTWKRFLISSRWSSILSMR